MQPDVADLCAHVNQTLRLLAAEKRLEVDDILDRGMQAVNEFSDFSVCILHYASSMTVAGVVHELQGVSARLPCALFGRATVGLAARLASAHSHADRRLRRTCPFLGW